MKRFRVKGGLASSEVIANGSFDQLTALCAGRDAVIVTDDTVQALYGDRFPQVPVISLVPGEGSKTLDAARDLYRQLAEQEVDRKNLIVGIGGGVVSDLAGFIAATYLRGIEVGFVPTTLLAQVDASIGGKNGINLDGYKNQIGTFLQPRFVLCDPFFLKTLPPEELKNGFAEMLKAALIGDAKLFALMEQGAKKLLEGDPAAMAVCLERAIAVKVKIVNRDERESGMRKLLNFGHTLGHAVEKVQGLPHGFAVAVGMRIAAELSRAWGLLREEDLHRIQRAIAALGLPTDTGGKLPDLFDAMERDKKRFGEMIDLVLLKGIGRAKIFPKTLVEVKGYIDDLRERSEKEGS